MTLFEKVVNISIIAVLLVHMTIGTPFSIGMADEILNNETISADIPAVDNTIGAEEITVELPVSEVLVGDEDSTTTITYTDDTTIAENLENSEENTTSDIVTVYEEQTGGTDSFSGSEENTLLSGNENENTTTTQPIENTSDSSSAENVSETAPLSTGDIVIPPIPDIITTYPQQQVMISGGRIDPLSLESYNVVDNNNPDITFCSYITYLNIKQLTNTGDDYIMRGDAVDIWSQLVLNHTLTIASGNDTTLSGDQYIFTGTHLSGQQFIDHLNTLYNQSGTTLFDIVTLKPKSAHDTTIGLSIHQSHRFIVFLGSDDQRYVLDPVRILESTPLLLEDYLEYHIMVNEDIQIVQSYTLQDTTKEETTTENFSGIVIHSPMEFLPYVLQGLISSPNSGDSITNEVIFNTGFLYKTLDNKISAVIPQGLIIKTADGENLNWFQFGIEELSGENTELTLPFMYNNNFEFGVSGQHLIFSQPIQLTLATPDFEEGLELNLLVQHEGQSWNTQGLTNNPNAICNTDGSVSVEDYSNIARVQDKEVRFYTCGASSFAIGYVGEFLSPNNTVTAILEQSDGKVIIGGTFTSVGGVARNRMYRLNADKTLDISFNPNLGNSVNEIIEQPDGMIVIGGAFTTVGGVSRSFIARLTTTGALDTSYLPVLNSTVNALEIQSDGKIIAGGAFTSVGGVGRNRIARFNTNGTLDTTFTGSLANNVVNDLVLQTDGKIIAGGTFSTMSGVNRSRIARINTNGTLDTTFTGSLANNTVNDLELQSDGKIIAGGLFTTMSGVNRSRIARINTNGTLDTTFTGSLSNNTVNNLDIQPDGKIIAAGTFTTMSGLVRTGIARLTSTGLLDTSFNVLSNSGVLVVYYTNSNKIIAGGLFTGMNGITGQPYLAFIDEIMHDTSYNARFNGDVYTIVRQPDGKVLVGGIFTGVGAFTGNRLLRLNEDNTLDTSFNPNINSSVNSMVLQPDGKIVIGGSFTTVGGVARANIARITSTGALDTSFSPVLNGGATELALQNDGMILIGGNFNTVGGISRAGFARLTTTGALDTSFNIIPNSTSTINDIEVQSDGQILVGGAFTSFSGGGVSTTRNRIARITSTGALDTSFNPNSNSTINDIGIQSDGSIIIGGGFTTLNGGAISINRIAKLTPTGTVDTSFNPNVSNGQVTTLDVLEDNGIAIGGTFSTVSSLTRTGAAKIYPNGILDINFNINVNGTNVFALAQDSESNLLIGGNFTGINGNPNNAKFAWIGLNNIKNNIAFWLKANTGTNCSIDGCSISKWKDNNYAYNNAIQPTGTAQPIYKANVVNRNPAINFNSTAKYMIGSITGVYKTVFAVRNLPETSYQTLFASQQNTDFSIRSSASFNGTSDFNYTDGPNANDWSFGGSLAINGKVSNVGEKQYHILQSVSSGAVTGTYSISSTLSSRGMYGNDAVAEMIVYSTGVDTTTANEIESYLATKYGITLDQSVAGGQNYILSNGFTSWSTGSAGSYLKDIAGIARDDIIGLLQPKSQTINNSGDIIVETIGGLLNNQTLMRSNNGGPLITWSSTELPGGSSSRIGRERNIQEKNGDVGMVRVTYDAIPATGIVLGDVMLAVDTDDDFSNGGTTLYTGLITGGYRTFDVNLQDNEYITFVIKGDLCIEGASDVNFSINASNVATSDLALTDQFKVSDNRGNSSGYYTTISISNLTGLLGNTISSAASIVVAGGGLQTISGTPNPDVVLDNTISSSWVNAASPVQFIKRNSGTPAGIYGTYAAQLAIQVSLPAYQSVDTYTGTITYTLYEN